MTSVLSFMSFHMNFEFTFFFKRHATFATFKLLDDNIIHVFLFMNVPTVLIGKLPIADFAMMRSFSYLHKCEYIVLIVKCVVCTRIMYKLIIG